MSSVSLRREDQAVHAIRCAGAGMGALSVVDVELEAAAVGDRAGGVAGEMNLGGDSSRDRAARSSVRQRVCLSRAVEVDAEAELLFP